MSGSVGEPPLEELSPGTAVLVAGPSMTGKYELALSLLAASSDAAVVVSTNTPASRVVEDYRRIAGDVPDGHLGVVDCVSHDDRTRSTPERGRVQYVNSPRNLTRIGVAFTETLDSFGADLRVGVALHSVSALLMYADVETVYKFLQVFTGQARSRDAVCIGVFDTTGDEEQRNLVGHHFDGVVETRENEDGEREHRVRGFEAGVTEWTPF